MGITRAALGGALALTLSACQTPWIASVPPERTTLPATAVVGPVATIADMPVDRAANSQIAAVLLKRAPKLQPLDRVRVARAIDDARRNHRVDPVLLLAMIHQESRFDPNARGPRGSLGLMQVRPFVAADVARRHRIPWTGKETLLDPAANVQIGACYLGEVLRMFPDPDLAIAAYNMGPYRVRRMVKRGQHPKPAYLTSVLKHLQALSTEMGPLEYEPVEDSLGE